MVEYQRDQTQSDDPVSQALRGLIDTAAHYEEQIARLWQEIERLSGQQPRAEEAPAEAASGEESELKRLRELVDE